MSRNLQLYALGLALAALLPPPLVTAAADVASNVVTYARTFVVGKGSAEYADVSRWMNQHDSRASQSGVDDNDNPFEVTVTTTAPLDPQAKSGPPGPPVGLPQHGAEGDVLTFKRNRSCVDGGGVETWTYEWRSDGGSNGSGGWRLTNYSFSLRGGLYCDS